MKTHYRTLNHDTESLFKDKNSRFLAFAFPILCIDDVKNRLNNLKKQHFKAVHHCYAYRLGYDGTNFRANDDGEPSGSAGRSILGKIDSFELTDTAVIVVRYFGGTLLGVPGLINAYKTATNMALQNAQIIEKNIEKSVQIQCDYPSVNAILKITEQNQCTVISQDFQLNCNFNIRIPLTNFDRCIAALENLRLDDVKIIHL